MLKEAKDEPGWSGTGPGKEAPRRKRQDRRARARSARSASVGAAPLGQSAAPRSARHCVLAGGGTYAVPEACRGWVPGRKRRARTRAHGSATQKAGRRGSRIAAARGHLKGKQQH